ncbi:MFS transporter [Lacimicrobium alkaliphilum]|nr:MFS transporter [Lacimicrobium alkaliphilum]
MLSQSMSDSITPAMSRVAYAGILMVAMMGAAVTILMPLVVGAFSDSGAFSQQQVGFLTAADVAGILLSSMSAFFWVRRCHWQRWMQISLLLFIGMNLLTLFTSLFPALLLVRFLAGIGCGIGYSIALAALGDRTNPDKAFGAMVTVQVVFGTVGFWVLPHITSVWGYQGLFQFFNLFLLLALILVSISSPADENKKTQSLPPFGRIYLPVLFVFLGVVAYYFAQGTVWAYLERIGVAAGLSVAEVGAILGWGFAISACGSVLAAKFVAMMGRNFSLWLTAVLQLGCLLALYLMAQPHIWLIYALATVVYQIFWSFIIPIMMGIFSDADKSGRLIVFCVTAFKVGLVIGPPVAAAVVSHFGVIHVLWLGAVAIVLSVMLLHLANNRTRSK